MVTTTDTTPSATAPLPGPGTPAQPRVPGRLYALKDGDTFLVADAHGDILGEADGLFRHDTRVLSTFVLSLGGEPPSLLSAAISRDNVFFTSNATNRPLPPNGGQATPEGVIHLERKRFLREDRLYECISCTNYGDHEAFLPLSFRYAVDFADMFEVRGMVRAARGSLLPVELAGDRVLFRYQGRDGVLRSTVLRFSEKPIRLSESGADFLLPLPAHDHAELYVEIGPTEEPRPDRSRFREAAAHSLRAMRSRLRRGASLHTSGRVFNEWIERSRADLALLTTELSTGPYPYAGVPWFSTTFGRDAIVTALQTLWLDATLAHGVLSFLARHQARETSAFRDSAPGKILHETRRGEVTNLGELPFGYYYGGVDTTPLFIVLAGAYAERTGDLAFIEELWPALLAAMDWIDEAGRSHGDGFVVYARGAETGLANQGWKDSSDSIFHADGRFPEGPIALVEVQGYVFAALRAMAALSERQGDRVAARRWRARAADLRQAVERRFWMEEAGFYGIALDGNDELCRVRASNAGHLLYVGLPAPERAASVASHLLARPFATRWGIRTLACGQARFNPMSYHNGSVWPHDTALCAAGLARYGDRSGIVRLLSELFEAAVHFEMQLPELFCGFPRAPGEPPINYPVACLPQAWAAGSIFMLLEACLGLRIDGWRREVHIDHPHLPVGIDRLTLHGLAVGTERVDLVFQRIGERVVAVPKGPARGTVHVLMHV